MTSPDRNTQPTMSDECRVVAGIGSYPECSKQLFVAADHISDLETRLAAAERRETAICKVFNERLQRMADSTRITTDLAARIAFEQAATIVADAAPGFCGGNAEIVLYPIAASIREYITDPEAVRKVMENSARYEWLKTTTKAQFLLWRGMWACSDAAIDAARKEPK